MTAPYPVHHHHRPTASRPGKAVLSCGAIAASLAVAVPGALGQAGEFDPFSGEPPQPRTYSVAFGGGPIEVFFEELEAASGQPINVVIPERAASIELPPIRLHNVTTEDVMVLFSELGSRHEDYPFALTRATDTAWVVAVERLGRPPRPEEHVAFHPVAHLLENHSIEDVSTTVATAWQMLDLPGDPLSHVKFHADTKLLIVTGSQEVLVLVDSALEALGAEAQSKAEAELKQDLEKLQQEMTKEQYRSRMEREMTEVKSHVLNDQLRAEAEDLRQENAELRAKLRELESRFRSPGGSN